MQEIRLIVMFLFGAELGRMFKVWEAESKLESAFRWAIMLALIVGAVWFTGGTAQ